MDVTSLSTAGFVSFEYPPDLRTAVQTALESWQLFCTLPMEQKRLLSGGDRVNDFGFMCRNDKGPAADEKELFHALRANFPQLLPKAAKICDQRATAFIRAVDTLLEATVPTVRAFATSIEESYGLVGFTKLVMESQPLWTFRYLYYKKGSAVLAHPHADRGGFTFHLAETEGGGQYYSFDQQWLPWPVSADRTIIFPSMELQHYSGGDLKALWHRVLPVTSTQKARYAMVLFVDFPVPYRFDDHTYRVQEFPPGFNYDTPFEQFNNLFVPREEPAPAT